jgi:hypothetical protein
MLLSFDFLDDLLGLGRVVRCAERGPAVHYSSRARSLSSIAAIIPLLRPKQEA